MYLDLFQNCLLNAFDNMYYIKKYHSIMISVFLFIVPYNNHNKVFGICTMVPFFLLKHVHLYSLHLDKKKKKSSSKKIN